MTIPKIYRQTPEVLANYDFADLLSGVGYVTFYGLRDDADVVALSRSPIESTDPFSAADVAIGSGKVLDLDYDFEFTFGQYVKGDLFVTLTYAATNTGVQTTTAFTKVKIVHYDGTTETVIGTQQTTDSVVQAGSGSSYYRTTVKFAVDKRFKTGDIIRVIIEGWGDASAGGSMEVWADGANRNYSIVDQDGIACNSNLIITVPFKLSI